MSVIVEGISRHQLVPIRFMQDAVAASQTDVQLPIAEVNAGAGNAVDGVSMPFDGEVVGISYDLSAAATAGSLTVGATVNGTEDTDSTQTITTATKGYAQIERGKVPFSKGDQIGAEITSSGTWDGTTADLLVTLWCLVKLDGI